MTEILNFKNKEEKTREVPVIPVAAMLLIMEKVSELMGQALVFPSEWKTDFISQVVKPLIDKGTVVWSKPLEGTENGEQPNV